MNLDWVIFAEKQDIHARILPQILPRILPRARVPYGPILSYYRGCWNFYLLRFDHFDHFDQ